jgi:hypothetical protein
MYNLLNGVPGVTTLTSVLVPTLAQMSVIPPVSALEFDGILVYILYFL